MADRQAQRVLRPSVALFRRTMPDRVRSTWPAIGLAIAMYLLISIETRWSQPLPTLALLIGVLAVAAVVGLVLWMVFFARSRVTIDGNVLVRAGLFATRRYAIERLARVEKATLISGINRQHAYFFLDSEGRCLFWLPDSLWPQQSVEDFSEALQVPITGKFENSIRYTMGGMRFPTSGSP